MNSLYSGFVLFILLVVCSSIPVPRKQTDVKDSSQITLRTDEIARSGQTRSGVPAPSMGLGSGERHLIFCLFETLHCLSVSH
jgi:hypothetical protein